MLIPALAAALMLALATSAPTDRPLVVIVLPQSHSADEASSVEASIRLRGELDGAGVEVRTIEGAGTAGGPDDLQRIAREQHAVAAIALVWGPGAETTDLWIADRRTGNFVHKRVDASQAGDKSAEVLAIRTAELIRANLVDVFLPPPPPPPPPAAAVVAVAPQPAAPRRLHLRVAAGPTGVFVRGAPPALAATLDLGLLIDRRWLVRALASGLATKARIDRDNGTDWSDLSQSAATLQLQYRRTLRWRVSAGAGLGAGLLYVAAQGHASAPRQGVSQSQPSFCGAASLALNLGLGSTLELSVEGQALVAAPPADVWAASSGPARIGQPTVLVTASLAVMP